MSAEGTAATRLSIHEDAATAWEADRLCGAIEGSLDLLRAAGERELALGGFRFRLHQKDRNVLYRIRGAREWFLKLSPGTEPIRREVLGLEAVRDSLGADPAYRHPAAIRASVSSGYILTSRVAGVRLHLRTYAGCLSPIGTSAIEGMHRSIGSALARFHRSPSGEHAPPATRSSLDGLRKSFDARGEADPLSRAIREWSASIDAGGSEYLVHGNFKPENVIVRGGRFAFLDFENCGRGAACADIAMILIPFLLLRASVLYPWRKALRMLFAFLDGYSAIVGIDEDVLTRHLAMDAARFYGECFLQGKRPPRIAGIPIDRSRLDRSVRSLMEGKLREALGEYAGEKTLYFARGTGRILGARSRKIPAMSMLKSLALNLFPDRLVEFAKKIHYARVLRRSKGEDEKDMKVLRHLVRPGDSVVDIGANFGLYTQVLSGLVGPSGRVRSIEPVPETFRILESNRRKLRWGNVELVNRAVSDAGGEAMMVIPRYRGGGENFYQARISEEAADGSFRSCRVETTTVDALLAGETGRLSFVKCDVEGFELQCIRGASETIRRFHPIWLIEVTEDPDAAGSSAHRLFEILRLEGYRPYWFDESRLVERQAGAKSLNYFFLTEEHRKAIDASVL